MQIVEWNAWAIKPTPPLTTTRAALAAIVSFRFPYANKRDHTLY